MTDDRWIWIAKWDEFQHYKPEPHKPPAWIKDYTKQLRDDRYLALTDRQRALLRDLRDVFAVAFGRVPANTRAITRHRHAHTYRRDLEVLNDAGFIEFLSREVLEQRLEHFYGPLKKKREEKDVDTPYSPTDVGDGSSTPRSLGTNPRSKRQAAQKAAGIRDFVHRVWDEYPEDILRVELADKGLRADEVEDLIASERRSRISVVPDTDVA